MSSSTPRKKIKNDLDCPVAYHRQPLYVLSWFVMVCFLFMALRMRVNKQFGPYLWRLITYRGIRSIDTFRFGPKFWLESYKFILHYGFATLAKGLVRQRCQGIQMDRIGGI